MDFITEALFSSRRLKPATSSLVLQSNPAEPCVSRGFSVFANGLDDLSLSSHRDIDITVAEGTFDQ